MKKLLFINVIVLVVALVILIISMISARRAEEVKPRRDISVYVTRCC